MGSHLGSHIESESPTQEGWGWRDAEGLEGDGKWVAEQCLIGLDTGRWTILYICIKTASEVWILEAEEETNRTNTKFSTSYVQIDSEN